MEIKILENEYWYGACVKYGTRMPLSVESNCTLDFTRNATPNQSMPFLVSSKGRYLWCDRGFCVEFKEGRMKYSQDVALGDGYKTLRGAYLHAMETYFPYHKNSPAKNLFKKIIYNTWIEFTFYQNQEDILQYACRLLEHQMPPGVLMIDDGWAEYYGEWRFHSGKFKDAKGMLETLHDMGFEVMCWICPYISADTVAYREAVRQDILIKTLEGEPYIAKWWNGYSAVLDLSNPDAVRWLKQQLYDLQKLGVDGFKFDAGDSMYYREDNRTLGQVTPDEQSRLWAEFGEEFPYNEYRVTFRAGGYGLLQRLCDKEHSWGESGVASLVPDILLQGITGHAYGCPDMIGGGEYRNFQEAGNSGLDQELFVRHCEIACLMPAMQFSAAPYRVLDGDRYQAILRSLQVREQYLTYIMELIEQTAKTGEPVIRYMIYEFPEEQAAEITDQFMLGTKYLVAPIFSRNATGRQVYLPKGRWQIQDSVVESRGEFVYRESILGIPAIFEKL